MGTTKFAIMTRKQTIRGYTRAPDKLFKSIAVSEHLLCKIDAKKCPYKCKVEGKSWCPEQVYLHKKRENAERLKLKYRKKETLP